MIESPLGETQSSSSCFCFCLMASSCSFCRFCRCFSFSFSSAAAFLASQLVEPCWGESINDLGIIIPVFIGAKYDFVYILKKHVWHILNPPSLNSLYPRKNPGCGCLVSLRGPQSQLLWPGVFLRLKRNTAEDPLFGPQRGEKRGGWGSSTAERSRGGRMRGAGRGSGKHRTPGASWSDGCWNLFEWHGQPQCHRSKRWWK